MGELRFFFCFAGLAFVLFSFSNVVGHEGGEDTRQARQPYSPRPYDPYGRPAGGERRTITCESQRGRYNYCRTGTRGSVRLERRLSDAPCRQYDTWGADGDGSGIWVSDGCRAVFVVESRRPPHPGGTWGGGGRRTITCRSDGYKYSYCPTRTRGYVRLERRLSDAPCRQYDTWGANGDGSGIWVDRGCSGVFVVE